MEQWTIGDVTVTRIVENEAAWPGEFMLPDATPEVVAANADWLFPHFTTASGHLKMSFHSLLIESGGRRILVDTCMGNDKHRPFAPPVHMAQFPWLANLRAAGWSPEDIELVVHTHLHIDHVGWNTSWVDDTWVPTFPNARHIIAGTEWDFFDTMEDENLRAPIDDSVRPIFASGQATLVDTDHRLTDEVWLEPTPGHTPGHVSVRIASGGAAAVITGDLLHHPLQCQHPHWTDAFDTDGAAAEATRWAFCDAVADTDTLVFGTHFAAPAGHIVRHGSAYRFRPTPPLL